MIPKQFRSAIWDARGGDYRALERELARDVSLEFRTALAKVALETSFFPAEQQRRTVSGGRSVLPVASSYYNWVCTGWNGVSMMWTEANALACHGHLKKYVSGNFIADVIPDLLPRGVTMSIGCFLSLASLGATLWAAPATGGLSVGMAKYGVGVILGVAGITVSCP